MKGLALGVFAVLTFFGGIAVSQERSCAIMESKVVVSEKEAAWSAIPGGIPLGCVVLGEAVYVALGERGVAAFLPGEGDRLVPAGTWRPPSGEVVLVSLEGKRLYAVLANYSLVPLATSADGTVVAEDLGALVRGTDLGSQGRTLPVPGVAVAALEDMVTVGSPVIEVAAGLTGKITEVHPEDAVVDLGQTSGVEKGMRFEIRSQRKVRKYNLASRSRELMPSDEVTGVVRVLQVEEGSCLVRLGRGDRARVGDKVIATSRPLTSSNWFPGYERELHRARIRLAPFVGVDTLTLGTLARAMYDYSFAFPMRVEAGFQNVGFLFGETFGAPFQIDIIPSYDTDLFEVGLGGGYSYSAHEKKRGFTFLQKVRLGTVDGINFTMRNSFIFQEKHDDFGWDLAKPSTSAKAGAYCVFDEPSSNEFQWNGFDAAFWVPLTDNVTMTFEGAFSQAGWGYGEVGIRTMVVGNGGDGTLVVPVSIGGGVVFDYSSRSYEDLSCDPDTGKLLQSERLDWNIESFGGPIVSIGIDYRWR